MTVTDLATTDVVTASTDTDLPEVVGMMDDHDVGCVVITDDEKPTGIVTDRMVAMACREMDSMDERTAGDVMTDDPVTIDGDHTHVDALRMMSEEGIRRLPITDDGRLTGIITLDDLLVMTASELSFASDVIERQTPASADMDD